MSIAALSSTAPLSKPNDFKYNGMEFNEEFDLDWYDYGARNYDAQIGRFIQVDPMADQREWLSTYNYVQNNPILRIDPTGAIDIYGLDVETGRLEFLEETNDGMDHIVTGTVNNNGQFVVDENGSTKSFKEGSSNIKEITTRTLPDGTVEGIGDASIEGLTFNEGNLQIGLEVMEFISFEAEVELSAWGFKNDNGEGLFINAWDRNTFYNSKDRVNPSSSDVMGLGEKIGHVHTHPGKRDVEGSGSGEPSPADKKHVTDFGGGKYPHFINSRHEGWVRYNSKGRIN